MTAEQVKPVYVLFGSDSFLLDAARAEIIARVISDSDPQVAVTAFESDAELAVVLDELRTLPFLAPRRAVVIRDADAFVSAYRDKLETYLENPSQNSTLLLVVTSWPKTTRLYKLVDKVGQAIDCSAPDARRLPAHISQCAATRGKKIDPQASQLLAAWIGADLGGLDNEIEKLALYVGERASITSADVAKLVTASGGVDAFDLPNAIVDGQPGAALNVLSAMLTKRGEEFRVLGLLVWHLRRVLAAQQAIAAGRQPRSALPNMPYDRHQPFLDMLKRRPLEKLQGDFRRLIAADLAMKTGAEATTALQTLVVQLCV